MTFPYYIHIGSWTLHPHFVFEFLAYFIGFRIYLYTRNKERIPYDKAIWVMIGATTGAALGSKALYWLEQPALTIQHITDMRYLLAGKTIVGGLLGGLIGVEYTKKQIGWTRSTGDDFVFPLLVGMGIGRIGCFLTGLSDHTYGIATDWSIGVDFGDGIMRHPTQLYEIVFLFCLGFIVWGVRRNYTLWEGSGFQFFMTGYLLFRFGIDFIKPTPHPYGGFNNIQIAALAGLLYYGRLIARHIVQRKSEVIPYAE